MMKKQRLLLFTCVIMLSFAGVGYSAWSENISIKSSFQTGNLKIAFKDPMIVNNELFEINADTSEEGVLDIRGSVTPDSVVVVEYDIYNESSIPVKYSPDDETLPDGITLDQSDTVLEPGEYLRGNKITIEPGKSELILPFEQFNSSNDGGWKEELKISWNIKVVEEIVEQLIETPAAVTMDPEIVTPATEASDPATETPVSEPPAEAPESGETTNEVTTESETLKETNDANSIVDNAGTDEGSNENVNNGSE